MKRLFGILSSVLIALMLFSAFSTKGEGIKFKEISFAEAKALSAKTGKPIFIDCYTVWCGPCKRMAATSFKDERVAKFYNDNFINLKIEMEKSPEGPTLARKYKVRAYPTLLIVNKDGTLIQQKIGMQNAESLLAFGRTALK